MNQPDVWDCNKWMNPHHVEKVFGKKAKQNRTKQERKRRLLLSMTQRMSLLFSLSLSSLLLSLLLMVVLLVVVAVFGHRS